MRKFITFFMLFMLFARMGWAENAPAGLEPAGFEPGYYKVSAQVGNVTYYLQIDEQGNLSITTSVAPSSFRFSKGETQFVDNDQQSMFASSGVYYMTMNGYRISRWNQGKDLNTDNLVDEHRFLTNREADAKGIWHCQAISYDQNKQLYAIRSTNVKNNIWNNLEAKAYLNIKDGELKGALPEKNDMAETPTFIWKIERDQKFSNLHCIAGDNQFSIQIDKETFGEINVQTLKEKLPELEFYNITKCEQQGEDYQVTLEPSFPFVPTTLTDGGFAQDTHWYYLKTANGISDVVYQDVNSISTRPHTKALSKRNLWAFVKVLGDANSFKIYNYAVGNSKALAARGVDATALFLSDNEVEAAANNTFVLQKADEKRFFFVHPVAKDAYLGAHKAWDETLQLNLKLGFHKNTSDKAEPNSFFEFSSVEQKAADVLLQDEALSLGTDVGSYPVNEEITSAMVAYDQEQNAANLDVLLTALDNAGGRVNFSPGKYYQLVAYKEKDGAAIYTNVHRMANGAVDDAPEHRYLQLQKDAPVAQSAFTLTLNNKGNFMIQEANGGYWLLDLSHQDTKSGNRAFVVSDQTWSKGYVLNNEGNKANVWSLHCEGNAEMFLHCGTGEGPICSTRTPAFDDGYLWVVRTIETVPVPVGEAKWATLCLPMPVKTPEVEGQYVYIVSSVAENGMMELQEIPAGTVIAKGTPVLLYSTNSTVNEIFNFAVCVANDSRIVSFAANKLSGTTARRIGFSGIPYYGLANKNKGVAFYAATSDAVPANKAYLLKSSLSASVENVNALIFDFGQATGVEAVEELGAVPEVTYYDLSGKRVFYPSKGVFITSEGKKVFIK